jgi:hypothetical protein
VGEAVVDGLLDGGIGGQVDLLYREDIIGVVFLAEREGVIAWNGFAVAEGLLAAKEREAVCGHEGAEEQSEDAYGELHGDVVFGCVLQDC